MPFLTVFTPAYNRAHTLGRTYASLRAQTCRDFEWLIIDDGSMDNTAELAASWLEEENDFPIAYYHKENGGLHTAYNLAIEKMSDSVLAVCIDSDDYMPPNAVELIKNKWLAEGGEEYGGIIGLDYTVEHELIGGSMEGHRTLNLVRFSQRKYDIRQGDKKIVCRTDLYKSVAPQKVFPGEKNFNPSYMHQQIGQSYDFLVLNEELCTVDYQPGGMTASQFKQYLNSPNSFMEIRKQSLSHPDNSLKYKLRTYTHYAAESLLAKKYPQALRESPDPGLMLLCTPAGIALYFLIKIKGKET